VAPSNRIGILLRSGTNCAVDSVEGQDGIALRSVGWAPEKGLTLVEALSKNRCRDPSKLVLVGSGPPGRGAA